MLLTLLLLLINPPISCCVVGLTPFTAASLATYPLSREHDDVTRPPRLCHISRCPRRNYPNFSIAHDACTRYLRCTSCSHPHSPLTFSSALSAVLCVRPSHSIPKPYKNLETSKLPASKLPNFQTSKLPNVETPKLLLLPLLGV